MRELTNYLSKILNSDSKESQLEYRNHIVNVIFKSITLLPNISGDLLAKKDLVRDIDNFIMNNKFYRADLKTQLDFLSSRNI